MGCIGQHCRRIDCQIKTLLDVVEPTCNVEFATWLYCISGLGVYRGLRFCTLHAFHKKKVAGGTGRFRRRHVSFYLRFNQLLVSDWLDTNSLLHPLVLANVENSKNPAGPRICHRLNQLTGFVFQISYLQCHRLYTTPQSILEVFLKLGISSKCKTTAISAKLPHFGFTDIDYHLSSLFLQKAWTECQMYPIITSKSSKDLVVAT